MSIKKKIVWLPYDFDTAIGINNDGLLVFDYQLEDIDYQPGGEPVYNGQDSVVWKNIRAAFSEELAAMYRNLRSSGNLSYDVVEQAFEEHQSKWGEAIYNEDSQFKYIDPFIKDNANYLYMLLGAKTEQRKWWLYNRFRYIDSKYIAGDARSDTIFIRPYAAADITITPYADIYATIAWDATITQERAARNEDVTLHCPYQTMSGNIVTVYSCSQLADIGDLSDLKVGQIDISKATRLQSLKVGADGQYDNLNLYSMTFGSNVLLKVIDARNCSGFGDTTIQGHSQTTVDISGCSIIEEIYFEGTKIQGIALPNGGNIKKLHLPGTITNLTVMNHQAIADFSIPSYANITTLRLENTSLDSRTILESVPANTRVRIIGFTWEADDAEEIEGILDLLDTMRGLDEHGNNVEKAQVSGTIHTDALTGTQIASFNARYPYINFTADHITAILTYKTFDGSANIGEPEVIYDGGNGTRVNSTTRQSTPQYNFTPDGWSLTPDGDKDENALVAVTADRTVYAAYTKTVRTYTVTWKNGTTTLRTDTIAYGTKPVWGQAMPTSGGQTATGWDYDLNTPITGNTTINALYVPTYTVNFYNGSTLLQTVDVQEGNNATYTGETPTSETGEFLCWNPDPVNVRSNMDCYAVFEIEVVEPDLKYLIYTTDNVNMTMTITGLNVQQILADDLQMITIPDTIQGYHVILG